MKVHDFLFTKKLKNLHISIENTLQNYSKTFLSDKPNTFLTQNDQKWLSELVKGKLATKYQKRNTFIENR